MIKKIILAVCMGAISHPLYAEENETIEITVHRSPTCGCCGKWIQHLKDNNFKVTDIVDDDMQAIKDKYGVSRQMQSCHTATVNGYVIEGHVPASDIKQLLKSKPVIAGLSVPGMPSGTPGMEMGGRKDPYQVISFDKENHYRVFSQHNDQP